MSTLPILTLTTGRWSTQQQVEHAHDMNASHCEWSEKHYVLKLTIILIFVNVFISKGVPSVTNPNFQLFGSSSHPQRRVQMLRGKFKITALFAQRKPRRSATYQSNYLLFTSELYHDEHKFFLEASSNTIYMNPKSRIALTNQKF